MAQVGVEYVVETRGAVRRVKEFTRATGRLSKAVHGTVSQLGGLQGILGRLALAETGRRLVNTAAQFKQVQLRLKLLSQEYGENEKATLLAAKAAKTFGLSNRESLSSVTDMYARLRPMGITLEQIEATFIGFNTAAQLAGRSAAEASGAFLQLSQALGSGRLQGDEYRSIAEQMPTITNALSKELKVTTGELKKLGSEGKITTDVIIRTLDKLGKQGADKIGKLMKDSPVQAFKDLSNAVEEVSIQIGSKLVPAAKAATGLLTGFVEVTKFIPGWLTSAVAGVIGLAGAYAILAPITAAVTAKLAAFNVALGVSTGLAGGLAVVLGGGVALAIGAIVGLGAGIKALVDRQKEAREEEERLTKALKGTSQALLEQQLIREEATLKDLGKHVLDKEGNIKKTPSNRSQKGWFKAQVEGYEAQVKIVEKLKNNLKGVTAENDKIAKQLSTGVFKSSGETYFMGGKFDRQSAAEIAKAVMEKELKTLRNQERMIRAKVEGKEKEVENQILMEGLIDRFMEKQKMTVEQATAIAGEYIIIKDEIDKSTESLTKAAKKTQDWKDVVEGVKVELKEGIVSTLADAVEGTKTWKDTMISVLESIKRKLIESKITDLLSSFTKSQGGKDGNIFGRIGSWIGFADGGRPPVGRPSVVGERGPELFVPDRAGTIIPNHQMGGSTTININIDGAGEGGTPNQRQLGMLISASVRNIIAQEQRPGGTLA
tara:strand:- start:2306 stop:4456 length:2151 start_codon:yes stop_codon:yes gene_type:complete